MSITTTHASCPCAPTASDDRRVDVLGVGVSALNMATALQRAEEQILSREGAYVCVTGVHGIMEAQNDSAFRDILNGSFMTVPDGMPLVWIGKLRGYRGMDRVYGPDFMAELCALSVQRGYRNFLYGGKAGVADRLAEALTARFPGLQIAGTFTPPFGPLSTAQESELAELIRETRPAILWIGLSTPKQERFMAQHFQTLDVPLMVGVGAAFDIHTGGIRDAPAWIKRAGLQWLQRLLQEPRRLWRRYLLNNPRFIWRISLQFLGLRGE